MPQALVVSGRKPAFCCRLDSILPAEKHIVPSNARPKPNKVCGLAVCPTSSGQNSKPKPANPRPPPINTLRATRWPKNTRAFSAFHNVAVENTTATRPLGIHWLAVRKHMKLTQNRHSPCARQIRCPRRFITCNLRLSSNNANNTSAAKPKR